MSWRDQGRFMLQLLRSTPTFSVDQIPDLTGRVILVTGEPSSFLGLRRFIVYCNGQGEIPESGTRRVRYALRANSARPARLAVRSGSLGPECKGLSHCAEQGEGHGSDRHAPRRDREDGHIPRGRPRQPRVGQERRRRVPQQGVPAPRPVQQRVRTFSSPTQLEVCSQRAPLEG